MLKFSPLCYRGDRAARALDDRALERETDAPRDRELIDDDRPLLKDAEERTLDRAEEREELLDDGVYALLDRDELVLGL